MNRFLIAGLVLALALPPEQTRAQTEIVLPDRLPLLARGLPKRIVLPAAPKRPSPAIPSGRPPGQLNALFLCENLQTERYALRLHPTGQLTAAAVQVPADQAPGQYTFSGQAIRVQVPSIGFDQTSRAVEIRLGMLLGFVTDSLRCGLISHDQGETLQGYATCPNINYLPGVGYQRNAFDFHPDRSVKWRQWDEFTATSNTTYSEYPGTYLLQGDRISMAFVLKDKEHYLTGTVTGNDMLIEQLEPQRGACTAR